MLTFGCCTAAHDDEVLVDRERDASPFLVANVALFGSFDVTPTIGTFWNQSSRRSRRPRPARARTTRIAPRGSARRARRRACPCRALRADRRRGNAWARGFDSGVTSDATRASSADSASGEGAPLATGATGAVDAGDAEDAAIGAGEAARSAGEAPHAARRRSEAVAWILTRPFYTDRGSLAGGDPSRARG